MGVTLSLILSPHSYPDSYGTDFHFKGASPINHCPSGSLDVSSNLGLSLCSWPSPTRCHQKGLSSNYQDTSFQFVFTTLTFQSLLLISSLVCLISFLDLLSSWNSLLWLTHFYFLLLGLQPPQALAFTEALTHSAMSPGPTDLED